MRVRTCLLSIVILLCTAVSPAWSLRTHRLDNGLEIFIEENHRVPLATIRITFRAGAIVETPATNGLCHLYEHMLFKGNGRYPSQSAFIAALKRMGTGSWNGGTSTEYVTYYITIPAEKLRDGLQFWAAAVMTPLLSHDELVAERQVVHNEIAGKQSEPEYALQQAIRTMLYPAYSYRRDVGGDLAVIDNATVGQLQAIKQAYYVPNNAALFVSGAIDADAVLGLAREFFGNWRPGPPLPALPPHPPLPHNRWVAVATSPRKGLASVQIIFRGPDAGLDPDATYAADVWGQMINDPAGRFKTRLAAIAGVYGGSRYITAGYFTQRDAGTTSFSCQVRTDTDTPLWQIIDQLQQTLDEEIRAMANPGYYTVAQCREAARELANHDILSRETPAGFLSNLSFWWASTSGDYYLGYLERLRRVTPAEVADFVARYLAGHHHLTALWVHPDDDQRFDIRARAAAADQAAATPSAPTGD